MHNSCLRKTVVAVAVVILFIGLSIYPPSESTVVGKSIILLGRGKTLYVGGSGPGNYSSIQDAIDNASDGDTVFVYNGTYYENVVVNKAVSLIGQDKNTTIIYGDSTGSAINVTANCVEIWGFMVINRYFYDGISLYYSDGNEIFSNIITSNYRNIYLKQSVLS